MKPERIEQGETYAFAFDISGDDISAFSGTWKLLQYPGDTPAVSGVLTLDDNQFKGVLSSGTTAALDVGESRPAGPLWRIRDQRVGSLGE